MIKLILCGILLSTTLGLFFGLIVSNAFKNKIIRGIVTIVIAFSLGFGLVASANAETNRAIKHWNNGYCQKCDSELELFDVEYIKYGNTQYYYKCENGHTVQTNTLFEKD